VVEAQWADIVTVTPPSMAIGWVDYPRIFEVEFFHASYSVGTVGMRNGYAKHVQSVDALFWATGDREPEWDVAYRMIPWHSSTPYAETALHFVGCLFPRLFFPIRTRVARSSASSVTRGIRRVESSSISTPRVRD
jgi:hypothetical protein